ncbi:hypothetical protein BUALT_Bualt10G0033800 [Buddleja alternifolia]|uniref:GDSL esterase/lipase n=1 Tax=Buddleja alternifolia TaxID=168488 RepID=A0AAV6X6N3_9LAMI|nr:hypothetical protein BUALT_Bualt10G0033800 [Buddleja alternifolia]
MHRKQEGSSLGFLALQASIIMCLPFVVCRKSTGPVVIFNFGDSNSDTGGLTAGLGLEAGYPYGRAFFNPPTGRASDGRLVIDFLFNRLPSTAKSGRRREATPPLHHLRILIAKAGHQLKPMLSPSNCCHLLPLLDWYFIETRNLGSGDLEGEGDGNLGGRAMVELQRDGGCGLMCEYLNTHYLSPYLDSLQPNFPNGVNYAICGATTLPRYVPFNLNIQILQYKHFHNRSVELHSKGFKNLVGQEDYKNALYTFDIGQNDLSGSFGALSYAQVIDKIPSFISEIRDAMWDIYLLGGKNFWVHNTGPLGCLPREIAIRNIMNASEYDEYGCIEALNEGAKTFNNQLNALCQQLRSQMKNSTIVYVDIYSIKYDLIANATSYGFKNPLMACCGYGGAPYNYNPEFKLTCLGSDYTVSEEGTSYINWDGTHYTEAANAIIASKILSTHYSTPPLQLDFFCNLANISAG